MNTTISAVLLCAGAFTLAAQTAPTTKPPVPPRKVALATTAVATTKTKAVKVKSVPPMKPLVIPAGAVKGKDGYRYTDAQGKTWIYRETPFGITKAPEAAALVEPAPVASADPDARVTAVADGGTVHFERVGPFGPTRWQKSKSQLTPQEQKIWAREQAKGQQ